MKEKIIEALKKELGFGPSVEEIEIRSDNKDETVARIKGFYYDYDKYRKRLIFRSMAIKDTIDYVIRTVIDDYHSEIDVRAMAETKEVQDLIEKYQFSDEFYNSYEFRCDLTGLLVDKLDEQIELRKQLKEEKNDSKYGVCIFAGCKIYYDVLDQKTFSDVLKENNIDFEETDLDLGLVYAFASNSYQKEYIFKYNDKITYAYEFVVGRGDTFESILYFSDERLSKRLVNDLDYANNQLKIEWI